MSIVSPFDQRVEEIVTLSHNRVQVGTTDTSTDYGVLFTHNPTGRGTLVGVLVLVLGLTVPLSVVTQCSLID